MFTVTLSGGAPWGFRIDGGRQAGTSIKISRLTACGKAAQHGIREGDVVVAINGRPLEGLTQTQAHQIIKDSGPVLPMTLSRDPQPETKVYKSFTTIQVNSPASKTTTPETSELSLKSSSNNSLSSSSSSTSSTGSCSTVVSPKSRPNPGVRVQGLPLDKETNGVSGGDQACRTSGSPKKYAEDSCTEEIYGASSSSRQVLSEHPSSSSPRRYHPPPLNVKVSCNVRKVWVPGQPMPSSMEMSDSPCQDSLKEDKENLSPVWQPFGPLDDKPQFRSVKLDTSSSTGNAAQENPVNQSNSSDANTSSSKPVQPNPASPSSDTKPVSPCTSPIRLGVSSGLPQYQNPTITLLQKAREGQLPKGAVYIDQVTHSNDEIPKNAILVDQRVIVDGDKVHTDSYYALPSREISSRRVTEIKAPEKYEGIGPTERGIPVSLRTGVKEEYASDWYRSMFKSLHKFDKPSVGRSPHSGGYMSEPEFERNDHLYSNKYATIDHRRSGHRNTAHREQNPSSVPSSQHIRNNFYHNQPRSIAEYEPGHSSIAEREARLQSTRYMPSVNLPKPNYIDGYESDSTLIRKTGKMKSVDPEQQKAWYREIQKGGDIPFSGLGKPAPDRPKLPLLGPVPPLPCYTEADYLSTMAREQVSPHRYQETEVNIHYRTPVRSLEKEFIEEEELRKRQEAAMKKFYEKERYKKQMQQLQEIEMRRHGDNFMPAQKSPIPLNRYDDPFEAPISPLSKVKARSMAKVLYNFYAQTARELSLSKDDIVYIIRRVDKNWYEGEHHGTVGIFPASYVEVIATGNQNYSARKPSEGHGKAKFDFKAQTPLELSLFKDETVVLTRKVDHNWFEGRIGSKKGIFPASYIVVLSFPGENSNADTSKAGKSSGSSAMNGCHPAKQAFRAREAFSSYPSTTSQSASYEESYSISSIDERKQPVTESLHVDTHSEPIPYRALYSYRPQNDDELELKEGDTVYVMEKCDDGWFVGTSLRTGLFGTFPGNYVERI